MIHNVCICITPSTFLRFMKKGKMKNKSKLESHESHPCIHVFMHASSSWFKKKIIACQTSSMIHNVCICITPPTFLRFMKKGKMKDTKRVFSICFIIPYNVHTFTSCHPSYSTKSLKSFPKKNKEI